MSNNAKLAQDLISSLELALPPVAVSITDVAPPNIPCYDGVVPAGCVFWQQAATRTFVTSAKGHALCSIGVHTHHLRQPALSHLTDLGETLKAMCDLDYVRPEEVAAIPVISGARDLAFSATCEEKISRLGLEMTIATQSRNQKGESYGHRKGTRRQHQL
jgi:hypothetical protein